MTECFVCFEEYVDFVTFPCGHELCTICTLKVLEMTGKCPLCCQQLKLKDVEKETVTAIRDLVVVHPEINERIHQAAFCDKCALCLVCSLMFGIFYSVVSMAVGRP